MATHSSILALNIPWTEETWPATVSLWGCKKIGHDRETKPPPQYIGLARKFIWVFPHHLWRSPNKVFGQPNTPQGRPRIHGPCPPGGQ